MLYPETLMNRVCPCEHLNRDYIHNLLKNFIENLKLLESEKYKVHLEIDFLDVLFRGEEITLIKIINQSKEVYDYLKDNVFDKHKNIKIDSVQHPEFYPINNTFLIRGSDKELDDKIIGIKREYKKDLIEAVKLFNEELKRCEK